MNPRFKIKSRKFPNTGRRRWHLQMIVPHGASTLTTRATQAEAVAALDELILCGNDDSDIREKASPCIRRTRGHAWLPHIDRAGGEWW